MLRGSPSVDNPAYCEATQTHQNYKNKFINNSEMLSELRSVFSINEDTHYTKRTVVPTQLSIYKTQALGSILF